MFIRFHRLSSNVILSRGDVRGRKISNVKVTEVDVMSMRIGLFVSYVGGASGKELTPTLIVCLCVLMLCIYNLKFVEGCFRLLTVCARACKGCEAHSNL